MFFGFVVLIGVIVFIWWLLLVYCWFSVGVFMFGGLMLVGW